MNTLLALVLPPMLLVPAMGLLSAIESSGEMGLELRRKALHVGVGLFALCLPGYLTERWMIAVALGLVLAWMVAVRLAPSLRRRFGACLHDTRRCSHGELYFSLGVAFLLFVTPERPLLYAVPLLIVTLADAAAAIVGRGLPLGRLPGAMAGKTLSGCLAFFVVAYLITVLYLLAHTSMPVSRAILVSTAVAAAACLAELLCRRGLDNVVVPVVAYLMLSPIDAVTQTTGA